MSMKDFYQILEVDKTATAEDIKKAYRKLAQKYHPDKTGGDKDAEAKFKEIVEAYEILSDDNKRSEYDLTGSASKTRRQNNSYASHFQEMFKHFRQAPAIDINIHDSLKISFMEAVNGCKRLVNYKKLKKCEDCDGTGSSTLNLSMCPLCEGTGVRSSINNTPHNMIQSMHICERCNGSGRIPEKICSKCIGNGYIKADHSVEVNIPAGIFTDAVLRLENKGSIIDGKIGHLFLHIVVERDPIFTRESLIDISSIIEIDFITAILGGEIEIDGLSSKKKIKIPAGTQPNTSLRLTGVGIKDINSDKIGDHIVKIRVIIPKTISEDEKLLLIKYRNNILNKGKDH